MNASCVSLQVAEQKKKQKKHEQQEPVSFESEIRSLPQSISHRE